ncbi:MAG: hypothetical protein WD266_03020 [Balneolales bacterium]
MLLKEELKAEAARLEKDMEEIKQKDKIDQRNFERLGKLNHETEYIYLLLKAMEDETGVNKKKLLSRFICDLRDEVTELSDSKLVSDKQSLNYINRCCEEAQSEGRYVKCAKTILDDFHPELKRKRYINLVYEGLFLANEPAR